MFSKLLILRSPGGVVAGLFLRNASNMQKAGAKCKSFLSVAHDSAHDGSVTPPAFAAGIESE
jgi:hypothetical protein